MLFQSGLVECLRKSKEYAAAGRLHKVSTKKGPLTVEIKT
jgi:hypothetical protein